MNDHLGNLTNQAEIRQALCDLVAEVATDLVKGEHGPGALLDVASDLEATARELRTLFRRNANR